MFFYRGREAIDGQLVQVIKNFRETYGLSVIPVSVDGVINPMLPDSRTDQGQAEQLGVKFFPAMMLVNPKVAKPLSYGFISQDDRRNSSSMSPATLNRISKECVMRNIRFPDLDITGMWVLAVGVFST
ncbi:hypothetical protein BANRA_05559 [Klebsiella pneumoniae]|nr:hypothetical protein BANRA_05559 [Klebsiella pneumoniae]